MPVRWPDGWPNNTLKAMRVATFAQSIGRTVAFSLAAFRQAFAGGRDLSDVDNVLIAAAACELHPNAILKASRPSRSRTAPRGHRGGVRPRRPGRSDHRRRRRALLRRRPPRSGSFRPGGGVASGGAVQQGSEGARRAGRRWRSGWCGSGRRPVMARRDTHGGRFARAKCEGQARLPQPGEMAIERAQGMGTLRANGYQ